MNRFSPFGTPFKTQGCKTGEPRHTGICILLWSLVAYLSALFSSAKGQTQASNHGQLSTSGQSRVRVVAGLQKEGAQIEARTTSFYSDSHPEMRSARATQAVAKNLAECCAPKASVLKNQRSKASLPKQMWSGIFKSK